MRRRSNELLEIREKLSMGETRIQLSHEIKKISEERALLMKEANFMVVIPPEQGLAMKTDLNIPWNKLRMTRRYNFN